MKLEKYVDMAAVNRLLLPQKLNWRTLFIIKVLQYVVFTHVIRTLLKKIIIPS